MGDRTAHRRRLLRSVDARSARAVIVGRGRVIPRRGGIRHRTAAGPVVTTDRLIARGQGLRLVGVMAVFLAARILQLLLLHPFYYLVLTEELNRGTVAREILRGLQFPLTAYRADDYVGGFLVVGVLASLIFRVIGSTAFALKLVPLGFFAGALVFWYLSLSRYASRRTALYFSLLFV